MADQKTSALMTLSAPNRTADYSPVYNAADPSKTYKALMSLYGGYWMNIIGASTSPSDATTYFFGPFAPGFGATATAQRMYIPRAGKLVKARLFMSGTNGTSESSTISFRLNDTTDTTISSAVVCNALPFTVVNSALSVAVAEDDYFAIKWVTPTWVTNPTLSFSCQLWFT